MCWREKVRNNLKQISEDINRSNIWNNLQKQIMHNKKEVDDANSVLHPSSHINDFKFEAQEQSNHYDYDLQRYQRG